MSKNHDESKDLRSIGRVARVNYSTKTISAPKTAIIGNTRWGRIDYLTHYCGWSFVWDNSAIVKPFHKDSVPDADKKKKRQPKQQKAPNKNHQRKRR